MANCKTNRRSDKQREKFICGFIVFAGVVVVGVGIQPFGCSRPTELKNSVARKVSPEQIDFPKMLEASMDELKLKTEAHKAWGLGSFDRWKVDQTTGELLFSNADGTTATAPVQFIGSFNTKDNSWLWAWDNPSVVDELKIDSLKVKAYGEKHGIEKLTTEKWTGTEEDAWSMVALAVKLCDANGAYRGPSGSTFVFMTFGEVKISNGEEVQ